MCINSSSSSSSSSCCLLLPRRTVTRPGQPLVKPTDHFTLLVSLLLRTGERTAAAPSLSSLVQGGGVPSPLLPQGRRKVVPFVVVVHIRPSDRSLAYWAKRNKRGLFRKKTQHGSPDIVAHGLRKHHTKGEGRGASPPHFPLCRLTGSAAL